jgi:hypothetical protein
MKVIDLNKSVYELTEQYPELIDVLKELGFLGVRNSITRQTLGRVTSIPQGCQKMDKDLNEVIKIFKEKGFEIKP